MWSHYRRSEDPLMYECAPALFLSVLRWWSIGVPGLPSHLIRAILLMSRSRRPVAAPLPSVVVEGAGTSRAARWFGPHLTARLKWMRLDELSTTHRRESFGVR
jgi:hypothetical protein